MKKIAPFLVLLAGILWGIIGVFVRRLNDIGLKAMDVVTIRAITTSILLFIFLFFYDKKLLHIKGKDIWCFIGTGIFSIVFFNFCYFKAITLTSLAIAAILLYTAPVIVILLSSFLFREKLTLVKIISSILTFAGCVFVTGVTGETANLSTIGILTGLGAGLGYALYSIFSRYALERGYHSLTISFYTFLFAIVGTAPFAKYTVIWNCITKSKDVIGFCFLFGLVSTVIPYIVYTRGLKEMENGQASIIASIEPVTATLLGFLLYHEKLSVMAICGALLVLIGIIINNMNFRKKES